MDFHEADAGTEAVNGLDLDVLDGVRRFVEFMVRVGGLEREVGLQGFNPVLCFCQYFCLHEGRQ